MADTVVEDPQIYLITPAKFELATFSETLQRVLDTREIGCVRLDMPGAEAGDIAQAADLLRDICHQRDVALVIADHFRMVGVHVVAEGGLTPELVAKLTPLVDFFAVGREIWSEEDPVAAMQTLGLPRGD